MESKGSESHESSALLLLAKAGGLSWSERIASIHLHGARSTLIYSAGTLRDLKWAKEK